MLNSKEIYTQTGWDNHTLIILKVCTGQHREKEARGRWIRLIER